MYEQQIINDLPSQPSAIISGMGMQPAQAQGINNMNRVYGQQMQPIQPMRTVEEALEIAQPTQPTQPMRVTPKDEAFMVNGFTKLPETNQAAVEMAKFLSHSILVPPALRSTESQDHSADVFLLISAGAQLGMIPAQALSAFYVVNGKVDMYVKTKMALCIKYGDWTVDFDPINAVATARGHRFDRQGEKVVQFTGADAELRQKMKFVQSENGGCWVGINGWADKWPDMLKNRAIGRLLDMLFPDILSSFSSKDELDDVIDAEIVQSTPAPTAPLNKVELKKKIATQKRTKVTKNDSNTVQTLPSADWAKELKDQAQNAQVSDIQDEPIVL